MSHIREYKVFEVDKYGNRWFVTARREKEWAESFIKTAPDLSETEGRYEIEEV